MWPLTIQCEYLVSGNMENAQKILTFYSRLFCLNFASYAVVSMPPW